MTKPIFDMDEHPHRRWNPLLGEWILVSPHRAKRPWKGSIEAVAGENRPQYDPSCYLCPGNTRAGGKVNPDYAETFVFDNDFAALLSEAVDGGEQVHCHGLVRGRPERGLCRVICFSPRHDLTLAEMKKTDIRRVIDTWAAQYVDLASKDFINGVTIFENKGAMMGCSNPHPHGQVWANESIPMLLQKEISSQEEYLATNGRMLLMDYLEWELNSEERVLFSGSHCTALVPHWAVWPYEAMIVPHRQIGSVSEMTDQERDDWAEVMKQVLVAYDNLFLTSFPYSMGLHQVPTDGKEYPGFQMHQHFYPPLLRSATVRKFLVGYEMIGEPQRDITAETAAKKLRELPKEHYRNS